jgi:hypothetical protein
MRKSVLLPQRGQYFHPRFTPARAMRGQFDAQRPHEFRLPKHPLHRATIPVAHPRVTSEFEFESNFRVAQPSRTWRRVGLFASLAVAPWRPPLQNQPSF